MATIQPAQIRAEAGDYLAFFSPRTIQKPLKGAQVELQPQFGGGAFQTSAILFSGVDKSIYRDFVYTEDMYHGLSWLWRHDRYGTLAANVAHNFREADVAAGLKDRDQTVVSLASEHEVEFRGQRLTVEAELSRFMGDHEAGDGGGLDSPQT